MRGGASAGIADGMLAAKAGFGAGIVAGIPCAASVAFPNPENAPGEVCEVPEGAAGAKGGAAAGDGLPKKPPPPKRLSGVGGVPGVPSPLPNAEGNADVVLEVEIWGVGAPGIPKP